MISDSVSLPVKGDRGDVGNRDITIIGGLFGIPSHF